MHYTAFHNIYGYPIVPDVSGDVDTYAHCVGVKPGSDKSCSKRLGLLLLNLPYSVSEC